MKAILIILFISQVFFCTGNLYIGFINPDAGRIALGLIQMFVASILFVWIKVRETL